MLPNFKPRKINYEKIFGKIPPEQKGDYDTDLQLREKIKSLDETLSEKVESASLPRETTLREIRAFRKFLNQAHPFLYKNHFDSSASYCQIRDFYWATREEQLTGKREHEFFNNYRAS